MYKVTLSLVDFSKALKEAVEMNPKKIKTTIKKLDKVGELHDIPAPILECKGKWAYTVLMRDLRQCLNKYIVVTPYKEQNNE